MRRPVTLFALLIAASPLLAQAPLVEKIEVSVVNVDVTVTDRAGKPVRGLTPDDFEIFEDGAPQTITNFYVVEDRQSCLSCPAGQAGLPVLHDERFRRKVLVLIDSYSMTPFERNRALERLEEFINDRFRGGEYDWSIGAIDSGLRILLPPTSDKRAIHDALDEIRRGHVPRLSLDLQPDRLDLWEKVHAGRQSIDAIAEATRAFASTSGKKVILLLTGQLLLNDWGVADLRLSKEITLTRDYLIHEANASNVNFYIINPEGIAAGDPSMYWIARETGGRLMPGNRVEESLRQFDTGSSNFYSLGYQPKHPDDSKYHRIHVRVKKGHYALQYREGYINLPEAQQIERTLGSTFGTFLIAGSAIPVTIAFDEPRKVDGAVIVPMRTTVPAEQLAFVSNLGRVDIYISIFDSSGRNTWFVHLLRDVRPGNLNETTEVYLTKGKPYRIVVAIRDQISEAVGVTQQLVRF